MPDIPPESDLAIVTNVLVASVTENVPESLLVSGTVENAKLSVAETVAESFPGTVLNDCVVSVALTVALSLATSVFEAAVDSFVDIAPLSVEAKETTGLDISVAEAVPASFVEPVEEPEIDSVLETVPESDLEIPGCAELPSTAESTLVSLT
jgi:hypothetical protein